MTQRERWQRAKRDWRRPELRDVALGVGTAVITVAVLLVADFDFEAIETAIIGAGAGVVAYVVDLVVSFLYAWIKAPGRASRDDARTQRKRADEATAALDVLTQRPVEPQHGESLRTRVTSILAAVDADRPYTGFDDAPATDARRDVFVAHFAELSEQIEQWNIAATQDIFRRSLLDNVQRQAATYADEHRFDADSVATGLLA